MTLHMYCTSSGRNLIMEYINSLTEGEQIDALSVLECMEKEEFDKLQFKRWDKKVLVENRKIKPNVMIKKL
ncbi:MAG: hypothetical protein IKK59_03480 [Lachnospiraceae bacterium]|nr:hypothetical protein [Lachnospiraceae bacterium]